MNSDAPPQQHRSFPVFTRRVLIVVAIIGVALLAAGALATLFTGLLLLFAGVLFAVFLYESSRRLASATNLGYNAAFAMVVFAFVLLIGSTFYFMGSQINQQASAFAQQFSSAVEQIRLRWEQQGWQKWFGGGLEQQRATAQQVLSTATTAVTSVVSAIGGLVLILFLGFYFAIEPNVYRTGLLKLIPLQSRPRVEEVLDKAAQKLWWWILGRLAGMVLVGVSAAAGLWMMGIPLPITLGVIAGVFDFVPNIGPLIAAVPAMLFAFQQGPQMALYVAGFYLALQFVESYFITPLIDEQQVDLPAGLILAAQLLFGMFAGVLGLLLATPLTVVIYVFVRELYVKDVLGDRSGDTPARALPGSPTT